jgi:ribulose-5-phosphate 4-epimerase/fuculose-1-phosphate aldolase
MELATITTMTLDNISTAEMNVRQDLAACYRLFVRYGWTDLIFTHLSARAPGQTDQYLINPYGLLFEEITASSLVKINFAGDLISGTNSYSDAGHAIHSAVLKARPDVNFVLHSHTRAGMAVSCMQCGILPLTQQANEISSLIAYHPYGGIPPNDPEECNRIGRSLGDKWLMVLHNHGLLAVGRTIGEAFYLLYYLEIACKVQIDVLKAKVDTVQPPKSVMEILAKHGQPPKKNTLKDAEILWGTLVRSLRNDTSYKK